MSRLLGAFIRTVTVSVFTIGAVGCGGGGDRCTKAMDRQMKVALDSVAILQKAWGGPKDPERWKEMEAEMEKGTAEAIKRCQEALKDDKDGKGAKALDCVIAAKSIEAMAKCEGADRLME